MKQEEINKWYSLSEKEFKSTSVTVTAEHLAKELADDYVYGLADTRHKDYTEEYKRTLYTIWQSKYEYFLEKIKSKAHIQ